MAGTSSYSSSGLLQAGDMFHLEPILIPDFRMPELNGISLAISRVVCRRSIWTTGRISADESSTECLERFGLAVSDDDVDLAIAAHVPEDSQADNLFWLQNQATASGIENQAPVPLQSDTDALGSLPVTYPAKTLEGEEQVCPTQDQLEMARMLLMEEVQALIHSISTPGSILVKVADVNMSRPDEQCPEGLTLITTPRRACYQNTGSGCDSIVYSTNNTRYKTVCGTVIGHAFSSASTDAFQRFHCSGFCETIEGPYVDGISITHGSPREHIWSFAVEHPDPGELHCPCSDGSTFTTPSFVGDDYTCESYTSTDPVWDGQGCIEVDEVCCQRPSVPVFCKELPEPTTDDIEVRLCTDEPISNERVAVENIELYIQ